MADLELPDQLRSDAQLAWRRYVDLLNPFRPDLHRYCLRLTGDLWDAEDLVQETILRGFATLGMVHRRIEHPCLLSHLRHRPRFLRLNRNLQLIHRLGFVVILVV